MAALASASSLLTPVVAAVVDEFPGSGESSKSPQSIDGGYVRAAHKQGWFEVNRGQKRRRFSAGG
jgi:hypothetical protein